MQIRKKKIKPGSSRRPKGKTERAFRGHWSPCSSWNLKSGSKGLLQILDEVLKYVAWRGLLRLATLQENITDPLNICNCCFSRTFGLHEHPKVLFSILISCLMRSYPVCSLCWERDYMFGYFRPNNVLSNVVGYKYYIFDWCSSKFQCVIGLAWQFNCQLFFQMQLLAFGFCNWLGSTSAILSTRLTSLCIKTHNPFRTLDSRAFTMLPASLGG